MFQEKCRTLPQIKNHNNTAADRINNGTKTMKATAVKKIFNSLMEEDGIRQITICTTSSVKVFNAEEGEWGVDSEDGTLRLADDNGTAWIDADKIVSIEI